MRFMKKHWFGLLISLVILVYAGLFILMIFSPKQDIQKRGFIKCTEQFVDESALCRGHWCIFQKIIQNNFCNFGVVKEGVVNWMAGTQSTPWENYLFEPELAPVEMEEGLQEFYDGNPNLREEMYKIKQLNKALEKGQSNEK